MKLIFTSFLVLSTFTLLSCNEATTTPAGTSDSNSAASSGDTSAAGSIHTETVSISADSTNMQCFIAYDNNKQGVRPVILIVPEWWGLNEYPKSRAKQLAEMGYFAVAVDLYGNGSVAANPDEAKRMAGGFYANPQLAASRVQAALAKAKTYAQADSTKTAAIGYCFGGSVVLNAAKLGAPFAGVVSFHGALAGVTPSKNTIKSEILVCHGAADKFISPQEVTTFKKQLDSVGAKYTFKEYPNATHAFTNPAATETGKKFNMPISYNPEADKNSWNDMKTFFERIFK